MLLGAAVYLAGEFAGSWWAQLWWGDPWHWSKGFFYATIMFLLALLRGAEWGFDRSPGYLVSLLYLAVFGSVIGFGCYLTLLGRIGLDRAAYVTVLFPIIALILSTIFEDMQWGFAQLIGAMLVLLGNAVVLAKNGITDLLRRGFPKNLSW